MPVPLARTVEQVNAPIFPLSYSQQRLWFLEQWEPNNHAYIQLFDLRLHGRCRPDLLTRCLAALVQRHEILRTTFVLLEGEPYQQVHLEMAIPLPIVDLRGLPAEARDAVVEKRKWQEAHTPFDLSAGPLIRALAIRTDEATLHFVVTMHHLITDSWSRNLFIQEFAALYTALAADASSPLAPLPIQYADYAIWQRDWIKSEAAQQQLNYWREWLGGHLLTLELHTDYPRPAAQTFQGAKRFLMLPETLARDLNALCQSEGVTPYMLTLAVFVILLHRYTGQEEIPIGTSMANRSFLETEGVMGPFTNTLVLYIMLSGARSFREILGHVREITLDAQANQNLPFEMLIQELHAERDLSRSPLFQVMFQSVSVPTSLPLPEALLEYHEYDNGSAKLDLTFQVAETAGGLVCSCEYNTDLFAAATIDRMLGHYQTLLQGVLDDPDNTLARLPLLTPGEWTDHLRWNATRAPYCPIANLAQRVEFWAEQTPQAVAVKFEGAALTYGELNTWANRLARLLQAHDVGPETCVGVFLERSLEMVVALLSILKAGGAYVPLDPLYPEERLASILEDLCSDAQPPLLLTREALRSRLPAAAIDVALCLDGDLAQIAGYSAANLPVVTTPDNLAYVIFTSGSTGRPKGVQVSHRSVAHLLETTRLRFGFGPQDVWTVFHSYAFDFSVWEIWSPLTSGGTLVVVPTAATLSPGALQALLQREEITILNLTPSALRALVEHIDQNQSDQNQSDQNQSHWIGTGGNRPGQVPSPSPSLRMIHCGGEALSGDLVPRLLAWQIPVWNLYGPTEATVWAAAHRVCESDEKDAIVSIGRALPNTRLYVLDANLQPQPVGIPGELHIGGVGLARGYLHRPTLTAERFVRDPFRSGPGARLYKTGDLAMVRPDGALVFLGRQDHQVKLRGFRIELGEIEAILNRHPDVGASVVMLHTGHTATPVLVAYVVIRHQSGDVHSVEAAELTEMLRAFLQRALPDYMIPTFFVSLAALPLNAHGKVDRKALPPPQRRPAVSQQVCQEPNEILHVQLTQLWESVLGVRPIGIRDDFFHLGGNSLVAIRLLARIEKLFQKKFPLSILFQTPTIEQMADALHQDGWSLAYDALVPIQPHGSRPPLFCVHGAGGEVLFYRDFVPFLPEGQPVYGLQFMQWQRFDSIEEVAARYIREIRTIQGNGPYRLGGTSLGGIIAYEMAQQLHAVGEEVRFLGMFDACHPNYLRYRPGVTSLHKKIFMAYRTLEHHAGSLLLLPSHRRRPYLREKGYRALQETRWFFEDRIKEIIRIGYQLLRREAPLQVQPFQHPLRMAGSRYVPLPYSGPMTVFRALKQPLGIYPDRSLGWGELVQGSLKIHDVPGFHAAICVEPRVRFLAAKLRAELEAVDHDLAETKPLKQRLLYVSEQQEQKRRASTS